MALRKILINETEVEVPENITLIQACEQAGVESRRPHVHCLFLICVQAPMVKRQ